MQKRSTIPPPPRLTWTETCTFLTGRCPYGSLRHSNAWRDKQSLCGHCQQEGEVSLDACPCGKQCFTPAKSALALCLVGGGLHATVFIATGRFRFRAIWPYSDPWDSPPHTGLCLLPRAESSLQAQPCSSALLVSFSSHRNRRSPVENGDQLDSTLTLIHVASNKMTRCQQTFWMFCAALLCISFNKATT